MPATGRSSLGLTYFTGAATGFVGERAHLTTPIHGEGSEGKLNSCLVWLKEEKERKKFNLKLNFQKTPSIPSIPSFFSSPSAMALGQETLDVEIILKSLTEGAAACIQVDSKSLQRSLKRRKNPSRH